MLSLRHGIVTVLRVILRSQLNPITSDHHKGRPTKSLVEQKGGIYAEEKHEHTLILRQLCGFFFLSRSVLFTKLKLP